MPEQPRNPFAPPGEGEIPLELAPEVVKPAAKPGRYSFAPPAEGEALELSLEIAKPSRRPPSSPWRPIPRRRLAA